MCVCGLGCVPRRTVPRRTAQTRLSQPACCLLARCRAGAAAAGVARVRALLQGHAPFVGLSRRLGKSSVAADLLGQSLVVQRAILAALFHTVPCVFRIRANWRRIPLNAVGYCAAERGARRITRRRYAAQ